ncbi:MAG: endo-1,4-beta-xylanase [Bacteroidaceae bacterium]|nr:endo-1,4-beta-xylanase [Bacteroidaceae bacterium]
MKLRFISFALLCMFCLTASAQFQRRDPFAGLKTLQEAYKDYFLIGVAVNQRNISTDEQVQLIKTEFNSITAENDMKPGEMHPAPGVWNFERADKIADFCRKNGIKLRGHNLMWHSQMAEWMFYDYDKKKEKELNELATQPRQRPQGGQPGQRGMRPASPYAGLKYVSKEVLYQRMKEHIDVVVKRYSDVIYCWDVFNEAISDSKWGEPLRDSHFFKIVGNDEYIRKAFIFAHEADPKALLFYNDYNECDPTKRDRIYNMIKKMKEDGIPVDGIGMQAHYNIYGPSEEDMEAAIKKYSEIVDHIHVTELDIRVNQEMGGQLQFSRNEGAKVTNDQKTLQEYQYNKFFRLLRKYHEKIDCVTFWNLSDRDSWLGENNYPLPFDKEYKKKNLYKVLVSFDPKIDNAQPKEDFKPCATCQPGQEYPQVNSEGYIRFKVNAPAATYVIASAGLGGGMAGTVLKKQKDGTFVGTTLTPEDEGFHYYTLSIDGAQVLDPGTASFYGGSRWQSGTEVPAHDGEFYANRTDIEHGNLQKVRFFSQSTNMMKDAWVYTPAGYDKSKQKYPVLYLQHGWGENETSWNIQGKADLIMDNLIANKECVPFIVVMTYGMTNEARFGSIGSFSAKDFETVLVDELIPYIDSHFRTKANRDNRAMAGLSMGGMETHAITLDRPEVFGYWGLFSGGTYSPKELEGKQAPKLMFITCGSKEGPDRVKAAVEELKGAGFNAEAYISEGTAHEFLTWRRSLHELAPMLFKK